MLKRFLVWSLIYCLVFAPANYAMAQTSIQVDKSAPANNQPQVLGTAGGKPQVNISTPNGSGLSHNKYTQFDVGKEGVILNNSNKNVQTQLGAWIEGNPNLVGGTAKTILNEVNSSKPSQLKGFVEVGGKKADVIIANPSGINVDGGGFINAGRATLTTGKPQVNNGSLKGFKVEGGHIEITGQGLNANDSDYTDIISKSVKVNAGVWAKNLGVTTGSNGVSADNSTATALIDDTVGVALDVSAIGGMYAGHIRLMGTDKGLGVRNAGDIVANVGEVVITNTGRLVNSGTIHGQKAIITDLQGQIKNTSVIQSAETVNLKSSKKINNSGQVLAGKSISIKADNDIVNTGNIHSYGDLSINSSTNIFNEESGAIVGQDSLITANSLIRNYGLFDGGEVVLKSDIIRNLFTGTILGDHIALAARNILNGLPTSIADGRTETNSGLIGARSRLDVAVTGTLTSRENGYIYSSGDWFIGQTLDADNQAVGRGGNVLNSSAIIDIAGDLYADVDQFKNFNAHYLTQLKQIQNYRWRGYRFKGDSNIYIQGDPTIHLDNGTTITLPKEQGGGYWGGGTGKASGGANFNEDFFLYDAYRLVEDTEVIDSRPGFINVGGNMTVTGDLVNDKSYLDVAGVLNVQGSFKNKKAMEPTIITDSGSYRWAYVGWNTLGTKHKRKYKARQGYNPASVYIYTERAIVFDGSNPFTISAPEKTTLAHLNGNMYEVNPSPTSDYLIETNPRLTNYRNWLGSDFMLARINTDPSVVHKRLSDGFYEQRLVREQIAKLTGLSRLGNYASDEEQLLALMTSGVEVAETLELKIGMSLSAEQVARLTTDIVWLEYVTVDTASGPAKVLAPKVYLRPGTESLINAEGGLVAARNVVIDLSGKFENSGNLLAANVLSAAADTINNTEGSIAGGLVSLAAVRDINNIGGAIIGDKAVQQVAGNNINVVSTTTSTTSGEKNSRTTINQVATIEVRSDGGTLVMSADNDINFKAAAVFSAGDAGIYAGGDINIAGVKTSYEFKGGDEDQRIHDKASEDVGSLIATGGLLEMKAQCDINVVGSQVYAEGDLVAQAGRDVSITEGRATYDNYTNVKSNDNKALSNSKRTEMSHQWGDEAIASDISGNTASITTGRDFILRGSDASASEDLSVIAARDISISGAENYYNSETLDVTKKSGFGAMLEGGRIGFTIGTKEAGQETSDDNMWHSASLIGSENGLVSLYTGKDATIRGSHVVAGTGDALISGENVTIDSQFDLYNHKDRVWTKQTGLTVSVGLANGEAASGSLFQAMSAYDNVKSAKAARTGRASTLYGIAAARSIYDTAMALPGMMDTVSNLAKNGVGGSGIGVNVSVGVSTSKTENKFESTDVVVASSSITSGRDTVIVARSDASGQGGDLNVIGSTVDAGGWVSLSANNNLNLMSAEELSNFKQSNTSMTVGASVSYGFGTNGGGWGGSANFSKGKGSGEGETVTHVETAIKGKEGVEFSSGNDTLFKGAQIIGDTVIGRVGGNLSIISEQDTNRERYKQSSVGASVSLGSSGNGASFNMSKQNASGNYASVNEQSGIFAGSGGFDITVGGHTSLVGALIDSKADPSKNSLTTASLSVQDTQNHSEYSASTSGFGAEFGGGKGSISPTLPIKENGSDNSTTHSAIAGGTVNITDDAAQRARTDQSAEQMVASLNRDTANAHQGPLTKNPDLQKLLADQSELVDAAGKAGPAVAKTAGDISDKMYLLTNDESWLKGGLKKTLLQAAGAGLVAELGSGSGLDAALGAAASQLASKHVGELANSMTDNKTIANVIKNVISGAIGAAAGGETGAVAASTMDRNNRQLHTVEWKWLKDEKNIEDFAKFVKDSCSADPQLCAGLDVDKMLQDAEGILIRQANRQVDFSWRYFLGHESNNIDVLASNFLLNSGVQVDGRFGPNKGFLAANDAEYLDYRLNIGMTKDYLSSLKSATQNNMLADRTAAGLFGKIKEAGFYGSDLVAMGMLPGPHKESILDKTLHSMESAFENPIHPFYVIVHSKNEIQAYLAIDQMMKDPDSGCYNNYSCAFGKVKANPIISTIDSKVSKVTGLQFSEQELLLKVYNDRNMTVVQGADLILDLAVLLAAKKLGTSKAKPGTGTKATQGGGQKLLPAGEQRLQIEYKPGSHSVAYVGPGGAETTAITSSTGKGATAAMDAAKNASSSAPKGGTNFIDGVSVVDRSTGRVMTGSVDVGPTLDRINKGVSFPHRNDGSTFHNRGGALPSQPTGYYTEYVHPTPGVSGPGPQRIVIGRGGEKYYTPDHYQTFIQINP